MKTVTLKLTKAQANIVRDALWQAYWKACEEERRMDSIARMEGAADLAEGLREAATRHAAEAASTYAVIQYLAAGRADK